MTRVYIPVDVDAPIACTASSAEIPVRIEQIGELRDQLRSIERTGTGLALHFPIDDDIEALLNDFAFAEKGCCQFWGFEITATTDLTLRWNGPAEAQPFLDELHRYFGSDEQLTAFSGLL